MRWVVTRRGGGHGLWTQTPYTPQPLAGGVVVRSVCSPTMFCAVAGTSTSAQIHVAHDGHTGRP